MEAAASGRGTLGIPVSAAKHYVKADRAKARRKKKK